MNTPDHLSTVAHLKRWSTYETARIIDDIHRYKDYEQWASAAKANARETSWEFLTDSERLRCPAIEQFAEVLFSHYRRLPKRVSNQLYEELIEASLWRVNWKEIAYHLIRPSEPAFSLDIAAMLTTKPTCWQERFTLAFRAMKYFLTKPHT